MSSAHDSLRKQLLFGTPPIAFTRNDLWSKFPTQHDQSEAPPTSHQYGTSALVSQTSGNVDCFLRRRMTAKLAYYHSRPKSYRDPFAQHHGSKALADPKPEVANHRLPAFCAVSDMWNNGTKMWNYCACAVFCSQLGRSVPLTKRIETLGTGLLYCCTQTFLSGRGDWCIRNTWSWRRISILLASLSLLSRRFNCGVRSRIVRLDFAKEKKRRCYW